MHDMITSFTLNNGITIPSIGYGTWQVENGPAAVQTVAEALRIGYRHIDTATCYGNEKSVGEAIARSGLDRRDLFVTSKVWNSDRGYDSTLKAFERSLSDLGLDYLDLYLIHWPASPHRFSDWQHINAETWRAMEELMKAGGEASRSAVLAQVDERINDWVHENTPWKTFYHCCGSIVNYLDDFVDMGVDILNPVQLSAKGMDAHMLKEKYGDKLVFWGGGVDTQQTLPFGTPEQVRQQVKERLEILSRNGGYVFAPIHNVVAKTPAENLIAMYEAVKEYNNR